MKKQIPYRMSRASISHNVMMTISKLCIITLIASLQTELIYGHGTMTSPKSRVLKVYEDLTDGSANHPATDAAINHAGSGAYFTWNQVAKLITPYSAAGATPYIGADKIPDGQLASGASGTGLNFSGLDLVRNDWDWPATEVAAGHIDLTWYATAPHDPSFFKVFITKADYNHKTPLAWNKMEFLGTATHTKSGANYHFSVELPERSGRHVLYVIWQRVDPAGEAFFATCDVNFSGGGGGGGPTPPPTVGTSDVTVSENAGNASIPVTLSKSVPDGTTGSVDYTTTPIGAAPGSDYTTTSGTLVFSPNQLSKTISIPIINDSSEEVPEAFQVTLSNPQNLDLGTATSNVTISDDDLSILGGYSFEKRNDWGGGYDGWLHLTNPGPEAWVNPTLTFKLPAGAGLSYFDIRFTHEIDSNGNVTVTALGTIAAGGSVSVDMVVSPAPGSNDGPQDVKLNGITLDKQAPRISIANVEKEEGDTSGQSVSVVVKLASAFTQSVHVSYMTVDGSATAGTDYTQKSGTLTFNPGQTQKTITVNYNGNLSPEGDKNFFVVLGAVSDQALPNFADGGSQATVTLLDDDSIVRMTATGGTIVEGNSGSKNMTFRLFLDRNVKQGESVSIDYYTLGHGATPGSDYTHTAGTATFSSGSNSTTITVPILGDTEDESYEQFRLHFENANNIHPITLDVIGQIIDDEFDPEELGNQRIVAYVDGTGGASSMPPANRVTHICLAFANLNTDGNLIGGGSANNVMKATNPDLKFLLSVGGWTWSYNFPSVAADPVKRANFVASCVSRCGPGKLDGIDLDWEWPGVPGGPGTTPTPQDGHNYTLLVQELRAGLNALEAQTGDHYEITAYAPAGAGIDQLELPQLAPLFDFVNVQGYDLHGSWDARTAHQAGLYHNPADPQSNQLNIDTVLKKYLAGGFTKDQLLIGAPFYCQQWYGVENSNNGLFQPGGGGGQVTFENLQAKIQTMPRFWDDIAKVAYLYDAETKNWVSLDDPQAMYEKAKYSLSEGFGGVFYWQHGGDTSDLQLLKTISDTLAFRITPETDSDHDGIDDTWEITHFGHLHVADETSNTDGDSSSDFMEFIAGTNPDDATSYLGITNISSQSGSNNFEIKAGTTSADLQYSAGLSSDSWITIATGVSAGVYSDTDPARRSRQAGFYRLRIEKN